MKSLFLAIKAVFIFNLFCSVKVPNKEWVYSVYEISYFNEIDVLNDEINIPGLSLPFSMKIEYKIFSNDSFMFVIGELIELDSTVESIGNQIEIVKVDIEKKMIYNQTSDLCFNLIELDQSADEKITFDSKLPKHVNPLLFFKGNDKGVRMYQNKNLKIELISSIRLEGVKLSFEDISEKCSDKEKVDFKY